MHCCFTGKCFPFRSPTPGHLPLLPERCLGLLCHLFIHYCSPAQCSIARILCCQRINSATDRHLTWGSHLPPLQGSTSTNASLPNFCWVYEKLERDYLLPLMYLTIASLLVDHLQQCRHLCHIPSPILGNIRLSNNHCHSNT